MELPFEPRANVGPRQPELPFGEAVRGPSRAAVPEPVAPEYSRQMRLPFDGPEPQQLSLNFGQNKSAFRALGPREVWLDPYKLRFSQRRAGGGDPPRAPQLRRSMQKGWDPAEGPVDVIIS